MSFDADSAPVARDFSLQGISILVVEDTEEFRHFLSNYLSRHGAAVFTAENGQAGLNLFNKHRVDVIMTDIGMPIMDGLQMGAAIRKLDKDIPIIFLSVDTDNLHLFTDGFTDILQCLKTKPGLGVLFDMLNPNANSLLDELNTWLRSRPSVQSSASHIEQVMDLRHGYQAQDYGAPMQPMKDVSEGGAIGNLSVLFAAHECKAREYLSQFIGQQVGSLYTAVNGQDGLRLFERYRPQLVIASVSMSGMSGLEMAERIRAECPDVQIILINDVESWSYQESKLLTLLKLAGNNFLAKPLNNDGLLDAIQFCLDQYDFISDLRLSASIFMTAPLAVIIADAKQNIIAVNPAFIAITGYSMEDIKGCHMKMLGSSRHDAEFYTRMWEGISNIGRWSGETWNRRKNGEISLEWTTIAATHDWKGNVANYVSVLSDVSRRLLAEEKLHQITDFGNLSRLRLFTSD